ncbi:DNA (cytosine-5-)-methyltransferase N-terminal subunit [Mycoplasma leonicaptivi]|uniref:DNA (cytosine-5-)-methyltransferase N-terminal subunit n=1 Tax=Mycoplasma leonicaptivi TaxID=36742 RepID=UPI000A0074CD|nr:DNA (cytosine-5-)-methyltransferase [Mycoplasma leonicaptivi]
MKNIKIFEAFSGIGSQYRALKNIEKKLNFKVQSLGFIEWYIDAIISYEIIHNKILKPDDKTSIEIIRDKMSRLTLSSDSKNKVSKTYFERMKEERIRSLFPYFKNFILTNKMERERERERVYYSDIKSVYKLPKDIDIFTYSFPCQDLSQQGKQRGIVKGSRSGLLFEVQRLLENSIQSLPKVLLLENVKALGSSKFLNALNDWISFLNNLGYTSCWKILNASDYGSAQNRERLFMVSILNPKKDFVWPEKFSEIKTLEEIIDEKYNKNYKNLNYLLNKQRTDFKTTKSNINKALLLNHTNFNSENYLYLPKGYGPTLTASGANSRIKFYFEKTNSIREINEIESYKYMGFYEKDALKVKESKLVSNSKMIFTCGNSISVEVLQVLFEEILKCI